MFCVFDKKNKDYYEFKKEIETKEQIKDFLNTKDHKIITQFERWWDKYRISLHELDVKEKQLEKIMRNYLKELGYE